MSKILFFFTSCFPFGKGETFIETEIEYLAKVFDKIVIISNDTLNPQTRQVPVNAIAIRKGYELSKKEKFFSSVTILSKEFWREWLIIRTTYHLKFNTLILNTMLQSWYKAKLWQAFIDEIVNQYVIPNDKLFFYSYWNNDIAIALAEYKKQNCQIKAFSRMHGWDVYFEANKSKYLPYRNYLFSNLNGVFAISNKGKHYYSSLLNSSENKIEVNRLGVKRQQFQELNPKEIIHILSISNIIPIKNLKVLLQALAQLNIPFKWIHIGDGPQRPEIEHMANELIPDKYQFLGAIPNNNVINFIKNGAIDIFVNVSLSEGIPVSIMEAMSFGIPCIATNVGGNSEIVNNHNGQLLPSDPSPYEIALAISKFHQLSANQKENKRKAAYTTWEENFNAEKNYLRFVEQIMKF